MSAPETVAERLDALSERAADEIRSPELRRMFRDLLLIVGEIAATRADPEPGTGITRQELSEAVGGAAFLASLGRMLAQIDAAREADVARVLRHVLAAPCPSP